MGIVHHASYLAYMEVARVEWLRRRGVTYASWAAVGLNLAVVEVGIRYRAPAFFDDLVDVHVSLTEVRAASVRFDYRIVRAAQEAPSTEGFTRLACVDATRGLRRLTPDMIEVFGRAEDPTSAGPDPIFARPL